jgi:hypothetical protein
LQIARIPDTVTIELGLPEFASRIRHMRKFAPGMLMPKTPVNEDNLSSLGEGQIGTAGRSLPLETEPIAQLVQQTADDELGLRVRALDTSHVPATLILRKMVRHLQVGASSYAKYEPDHRKQDRAGHDRCQKKTPFLMQLPAAPRLPPRD